MSARSTTLLTLLDEVGVGKADRSTTGITVSEEFDHTEEKGSSLARPSGYLADLYASE